MSFPERIVCLAAEVPEILYRLQALDKVVGISAYTTRPTEALSIPKASGFKFGSTDRIMAMQPDLVILTSGVQKVLAAELAAQGATLLHFNPHRFDELYDSISLLGNLVNKPEEAALLNHEIRSEVAQIQARAKSLSKRPKVYFEEWMDPLLCGTGWVSDLIEMAGGQDIFRERSIAGRKAQDRGVTYEEVVHLQPDIILASWCGKPLDKPTLLGRPGFDTIPAVQTSQVYEVESEILQFGLMLVDSLKRLADIIEENA